MSIYRERMRERQRQADEEYEDKVSAIQERHNRLMDNAPSIYVVAPIDKNTGKQDIPKFLSTFRLRDKNEAMGRVLANSFLRKTQRAIGSKFSLMPDERMEFFVGLKGEEIPLNSLSTYLGGLNSQEQKDALSTNAGLLKDATTGQPITFSSADYDRANKHVSKALNSADDYRFNISATEGESRFFKRPLKYLQFNTDPELEQGRLDPRTSRGMPLMEYSDYEKIEPSVRRRKEIERIERNERMVRDLHDRMVSGSQMPVVGPSANQPQRMPVMNTEPQKTVPMNQVPNQPPIPQTSQSPATQAMMDAASREASSADGNQFEPKGLHNLGEQENQRLPFGLDKVVPNNPNINAAITGGVTPNDPAIDFAKKSAIDFGDWAWNTPNIGDNPDFMGGMERGVKQAEMGWESTKGWMKDRFGADGKENTKRAMEIARELAENPIEESKLNQFAEMFPITAAAIATASLGAGGATMAGFGLLGRSLAAIIPNLVGFGSIGAGGTNVESIQERGRPLSTAEYMASAGIEGGLNTLFPAGRTIPPAAKRTVMDRFKRAGRLMGTEGATEATQQTAQNVILDKEPSENVGRAAGMGITGAGPFSFTGGGRPTQQQNQQQPQRREPNPSDLRQQEPEPTESQPLSYPEGHPLNPKIKYGDSSEIQPEPQKQEQSTFIDTKIYEPRQKPAQPAPEPESKTVIMGDGNENVTIPDNFNVRTKEMVEYFGMGGVGNVSRKYEVSKREGNEDALKVIHSVVKQAPELVAEQGDLERVAGKEYGDFLRKQLLHLAVGGTTENSGGQEYVLSSRQIYEAVDYYVDVAMTEGADSPSALWANAVDAVTEKKKSDGRVVGKERDEELKNLLGGWTLRTLQKDESEARKKIEEDTHSLKDKRLVELIDVTRKHAGKLNEIKAQEKFAHQIDIIAEMLDKILIKGRHHSPTPPPEAIDKILSDLTDRYNKNQIDPSEYGSDLWNELANDFNKRLPKEKSVSERMDEASAEFNSEEGKKGLREFVKVADEVINRVLPYTTLHVSPGISRQVGEAETRLDENGRASHHISIFFSLDRLRDGKLEKFLYHELGHSLLRLMDKDTRATMINFVNKLKFPATLDKDSYDYQISARGKAEKHKEEALGMTTYQDEKAAELFAEYFTKRNAAKMSSKQKLPKSIQKFFDKVIEFYNQMKAYVNDNLLPGEKVSKAEFDNVMEILEKGYRGDLYKEATAKRPIEEILAEPLKRLEALKKGEVASIKHQMFERHNGRDESLAIQEGSKIAAFAYDRDIEPDTRIGLLRRIGAALKMGYVENPNAEIDVNTIDTERRQVIFRTLDEQDKKGVDFTLNEMRVNKVLSGWASIAFNDHFGKDADGREQFRSGFINHIMGRYLSKEESEMVGDYLVANPEIADALNNEISLLNSLSSTIAERVRKQISKGSNRSVKDLLADYGSEKNTLDSRELFPERTKAETDRIRRSREGATMRGTESLTSRYDAFLNLGMSEPEIIKLGQDAGVKMYLSPNDIIEITGPPTVNEDGRIWERTDGVILDKLLKNKKVMEPVTEALQAINSPANFSRSVIEERVSRVFDLKAGSGLDESGRFEDPKNIRVRNEYAEAVTQTLKFFDQMLDFLVQAEVFDADWARTYRQANPLYIPVYKIGEKGLEKKRSGTGLPLHSFDYSLKSYTYMALESAIDNLLAKRLAKLGKHWSYSILTGVKDKPMNKAQAVEAKEISESASDRVEEILMRDISDRVEKRKRGLKNKLFYKTKMKNGRLAAFELTITDIRLMKAINSLSHELATDLSKGMKVSKWVESSFVRNMPPFLVNVWLQDISGWQQIQTGTWPKPFETSQIARSLRDSKLGEKIGESEMAKKIRGSKLRKSLPVVKHIPTRTELKEKDQINDRIYKLAILSGNGRGPTTTYLNQRLWQDPKNPKLYLETKGEFEARTGEWPAVLRMPRRAVRKYFEGIRWIYDKRYFDAVVARVQQREKAGLPIDMHEIVAEGRQALTDFGKPVDAFGLIKGLANYVPFFGSITKGKMAALRRSREMLPGGPKKFNMNEAQKAEVNRSRLAFGIWMATQALMAVAAYLYFSDDDDDEDADRIGYSSKGLYRLPNGLTLENPLFMAWDYGKILGLPIKYAIRAALKGDKMEAQRGLELAAWELGYYGWVPSIPLIPTISELYYNRNSFGNPIVPRKKDGTLASDFPRTKDNLAYDAAILTQYLFGVGTKEGIAHGIRGFIPSAGDSLLKLSDTVYNAAGLGVKREFHEYIPFIRRSSSQKLDDAWDAYNEAEQLKNRWRQLKSLADDNRTPGKEFNFPDALTDELRLVSDYVDEVNRISSDAKGNAEYVKNLLSEKELNKLRVRVKRGLRRRPDLKEYISQTDKEIDEATMGDLKGILVNGLRNWREGDMKKLYDKLKAEFKKRDRPLDFDAIDDKISNLYDQFHMEIDKINEKEK